MLNTCEPRPSTGTLHCRVTRPALLILMSLVPVTMSACHHHLNFAPRHEARASTKRATENPSGDVFATIYQRTERNFANAAFFKPSATSIADGAGELAPLIVIEATVDGLGYATFPQFGAIEPSDNGQLTIDTTRPTIYAGTGQIELRGVKFQTVTFVWFHEDRTNLKACMAAGAIRAVVGDDGFPLLWEIGRCTGEPTSRANPRMLYVSSSLELEAEDRYGPPLTGRRHAIESDTAESVVPRIIEDGPIPMGPYVYIDRTARHITTLLCRCSPSQMDAIVTTATYSLQSLVQVMEVLASIGRSSDDGTLCGIQFSTSPELLVRWPRSVAPRTP